MTMKVKSTTTVKPFTATVKVESVLFKLAPYGQLIPFIKLSKHKKLTTHNFDALVFDSIRKPAEDGYMAIGTNLKIRFNKKLEPTKIVIVKKGGDAVLPPDKCPSCDNKLKEVDGEYWCSNLFCPGSARGGLFKMSVFANGPSSNNVFNNFLNGFAANEEKAYIDNITDFKNLMSIVPSKETQGRLDNWVKLYGKEEGEQLWEIEVSLSKFLSNQISTAHFWAICNFPLITEDVFNELVSINPILLLLNDKPTLSDVKKLSVTAQAYINVNFDFITFLVDFLNSCKKQ